jgi:type I restriction enzyme S subunit
MSLPEGWHRSALGDCAQLLTGHAFPSQKYTDANQSSTRLLRGDNVMQGTLRWEDAKYWPIPYEKQLARYEMRAGDIVIAMDRPITNAGLKCSLVKPEDLPCLLVQRVARIRAKDDVDQGYLAHVLQTHGFIQHLTGQKTETAVPHISPNDLRDFEIALPLRNEQRRIAGILSTWDQAISITERLLANSIDQSNILARQVLTGKRSLRSSAERRSYKATAYGDIPNTWEFVKIKTVATEVSTKLGSGTPHPVLSCTKHRGLVDSLSYFNKQVFSLDTSTYKVAPRSSFVYATNHIEEGSIGYQNLYDFGLVSPMYTVFKTDLVVCDEYLYRLLKTEHYRQIFAAATNASVDRRGSLRWNNFKELYIPLPPYEEQMEIASLLMCAEREIELLESQLKSLQAEKIALMFQLLTGARRVRTEEREPEVTT